MAIHSALLHNTKPKCLLVRDASVNLLQNERKCQNKERSKAN